jgi:putative ABC transport system ATP-binding protein
VGATVTHDPVAASYSDRAVFLGDGRRVADLAAPTRESTLAELRRVTP